MIALCKCGIDMMEHDDMDHDFEAAGTKYRCGDYIKIDTCPCCRQNLETFCARTRYHDEHNVECGPLTGEKLW